MESTSEQQEAQNIYNLLNLQIINIVIKKLDSVVENPINGVVDIKTNQTRKKKNKNNNNVTKSSIKVISTVPIDDDEDLKDIKTLINDFNTQYSTRIKVLSNHLEHLILENKFITSEYYQGLIENPIEGVDMNILANKQEKASLIYKSIIVNLKEKIQMFPRNKKKIDDDDKKFLNVMEKYYIYKRPIYNDLKDKYRKIISTTTELPDIDDNKDLSILHKYLRCDVYNDNNGEKCCNENCCKSANQLNIVIKKNKENFLSVIDSIEKDSIENSDETLYTKYFVKPSSCSPAQAGKRRRTRRKQRKTKRVKRKNTRRKRRRN
jgi:hypothetical protein